MSAPIPLFELSPGHDRAALARAFAATGRLQVRDLLTARAAETIHAILSRDTRWGVAWSAGAEGPFGVSAEAGARMPPEERQAIGRKVDAAMRDDAYAFLYAHYPMLEAYLGKWVPGGPHDLLLEHLNAPEFLDFIRAVSGMTDLVKADAQATLYRPGQFLAVHDDLGTSGEHRRLAYVLNFTRGPWRPDWGGYLLFYDEAGDVTAGFRPRFNALNLFAVPQRHNVSLVAPYAPDNARLAITGWFRNG